MEDYDCLAAACGLQRTIYVQRTLNWSRHSGYWLLYWSCWGQLDVFSRAERGDRFWDGSSPFSQIVQHLNKTFCLLHQHLPHEFGFCGNRQQNLHFFIWLQLCFQRASPSQWPCTGCGRGGGDSDKPIPVTHRPKKFPLALPNFSWNYTAICNFSTQSSLFLSLLLPVADFHAHFNHLLDFPCFLPQSISCISDSPRATTSKQSWNNTGT